MRTLLSLFASLAPPTMAGRRSRPSQEHGADSARDEPPPQRPRVAPDGAPDADAPPPAAAAAAAAARPPPAAAARPTLIDRRAEHLAHALRVGARYAVFDEGAGGAPAEGVHPVHAGRGAARVGAHAAAQALLDARDDAARERTGRIQVRGGERGGGVVWESFETVPRGGAGGRRAGRRGASGRRVRPPCPLPLPTTHVPPPSCPKAASKKTKKAPTTTWRPSRPVDAPPRPPPGGRVPPLANMAAAAVAAHMDAVSSVDGLPDGVRAKLAAAAHARRALSARAAHVLAAGAPADVSIPNASGLDAPGMAAFLGEVGSPSLERLALGFCGRGLGDAAAIACARPGPRPLLQHLALAGAYRLTDVGLAALLGAAPGLVSLALPHASALGGFPLTAAPPTLTRLDLSHCRAVTGGALLAALGVGEKAGKGLPALEALALDAVPAVDDAFLLAAAPALPALAELSVCACAGVGDAGLAAIAARGGLTALAADGAALTDEGLATLAASCRGLRSLSIASCGALSDVALAAAVAALGSLTALSVAKIPAVGAATIAALTRGAPRLASLDVSWCRRFPGEALGALADARPGLKEVTCYGCTQIPAAVLDGHSNDALVCVGAPAGAGVGLERAKAVIVVPS